MSCLHNDLVYDANVGEEICVGCGLVVAERLPVECIPQAPEEQYEPTEENHLDIIVRDITHRGHFTPDIAQSAMMIYEKLIKSGLFQYTPMPNLMAYAFYNACFEEKVPRTMGEISAITGVHPNKLWQLEKRDQGQLKRCLASDVIERFARYFHLGYKDVQAMKNLLLNIESTMTSKSV